MDMLINAVKIQTLRKDKLWSQEEMATASGLGLRTIQRVERSGRCSQETLKAIAATFEVDAKSLLISNSLPEDYSNVQLGYTILSFLFTSFGVCLYLFVTERMQPDVFVACTGLVMFVSSLFGTLTVRITDQTLIWYFGIGFWKKKLPLSSIQTVHSVRNKGWWGWGIRYYGQGWLYNVSGLRAVELSLVEGNRIRIGTDEPDILFNALSTKLESI